MVHSFYIHTYINPYTHKITDYRLSNKLTSLRRIFMGKTIDKTAICTK